MLGMIYLVFIDPDLPAENKELAGMYLDVIDAQDFAAKLSLRFPGAIYEVLKYHPGECNGAHWSCDDLAQEGVFSSAWRDGRCIKEESS